MARQVAPFRNCCVPYAGGQEQTYLHGVLQCVRWEVCCVVWVWLGKQLTSRGPFRQCLEGIVQAEGGVNDLAEKGLVQKEWAGPKCTPCS